jgi:hypothetical protein
MHPEGALALMEEAGMWCTFEHEPISMIDTWRKKKNTKGDAAAAMMTRVSTSNAR